MIKRDKDFQSEVRKEMRGGKGEVTVRNIWTPKTELKSNYRLFAKLVLPPGASIGFHIHDREEEVYVVLRGKAEVDDNGVTEVLNEGDTILTGGGEGHSVRNVGDTDLILMAVIACYPAGQ